MKSAAVLPDWAPDIYFDQARTYGHDLVRNLPQFKSIISRVAADAFDPLPDPAVLVVAARLLHDLVSIRRQIPLNAGTAWVLVETYLLLHGLTIVAEDDEVATLLESLRHGRKDTVSTLRNLREIAETESFNEVRDRM